MPPRDFPRPVAVFNDRFVFTTLSAREFQSHGRVPFCHPSTGKPCVAFSLDEQISYTPFALDHGPLNLAMTFYACEAIHDKLNARQNRNKPICLYTSPVSKTKSNMALMAALYFLLVGRADPWEAFMPVGDLEVMPFRDAGHGPMNHGLSIQDCLYGVHKAIANGLLDLCAFDPRYYEYYETVKNGDLNILGPFVPFASPHEAAWIKAMRSSRPHLSHTKARVTTHAFKCVLDVFQQQDVGLVVRLNEELYDRRHFLDLGMDHVEMYFDDGSNPSDEIVRQFIDLADEVIQVRGKKVAVHCKAGLGRTGVLIGAYFIYKYAFSAQEVIGFMRIVRPGMVVGPQQQYMIRNQMKWVGWAARDQALKELASPAKSVNPLATPPAESACVLPDHRSLTHDHRIIPSSSPRSPSSRSGGSAAAHLVQKGGDAAGQPRKSPMRQLRAESYDDPSAPTTPEYSFDVEPPSPTPSLTEATDYRKSGTSPSSPKSVSRGTKRAAARIPLPPSTSPSALLESHMPALRRSSSRSSVLSLVSEQDARPTKRRGVPIDRQTGLSSPPPSRDTSPADSEGAAEAEELPHPLLSVPTQRQQVELADRRLHGDRLPRGRNLVPEKSTSSTAQAPQPSAAQRSMPEVRSNTLATPHKSASTRSLLTPPRLARQVLGTKCSMIRNVAGF